MNGFINSNWEIFLKRSIYLRFIKCKTDLGYTAKAIQTGTLTNDWIEVMSGLSLSDSIAPVASYLIDSEAFIETE